MKNRGLSLLETLICFTSVGIVAVLALNDIAKRDKNNQPSIPLEGFKQIFTLSSEGSRPEEKRLDEIIWRSFGVFDKDLSGTIDPSPSLKDLDKGEGTSYQSIFAFAGEFENFQVSFGGDQTISDLYFDRAGKTIYMNPEATDWDLALRLVHLIARAKDPSQYQQGVDFTGPVAQPSGNHLRRLYLGG